MRPSWQLHRADHYPSPSFFKAEEDGTLTLATRHENGNDASVSRWKKES